MEDLLALKDSQGTAWARRHLSECADCQREFDSVHQRVAQLRTLANLNPPRDRWPVIRERVMAERRQSRMVRVRWGSLALAASLAGILVVKSVQTHRTDASATQDLASLQNRSEQLEETLREYDPQSRVMSARTAGAVADIEDRIAALDDELGQDPAISHDNLVNLWRQRVNLMEGLVNVHVARATYSGM